MAERNIPEEAVHWVLAHYHTRRPAPQRGSAAEIYIGEFEGRNLKVYVERGSDPPFVKTTVWEGDE